MEKLKLKHKQLNASLNSLEKSVINFKNFENYPQNIDFIDQQELYRALRDSMIQRFEFTVDLFWKYIKRYLQTEIKQDIKIGGPKPVIRDACKAKLITEQDAEKILDMIDDRNMSSHIYKEEIADQIGNRIGEYYKIVKKYVDQLASK